MVFGDDETKVRAERARAIGLFRYQLIREAARNREESSAPRILSHRLGMAARSVLSRNTRSACRRPTLRPTLCRPF